MTVRGWFCDPFSGFGSTCGSMPTGETVRKAEAAMARRESGLCDQCPRSANGEDGLCSECREAQ